MPGVRREEADARAGTRRRSMRRAHAGGILTAVTVPSVSAECATPARRCRGLSDALVGGPSKHTRPCGAAGNTFRLPVRRRQYAVSVILAFCSTALWHGFVPANGSRTSTETRMGMNPKHSKVQKPDGRKRDSKKAERVQESAPLSQKQKQVKRRIK